MLMAMILGLFTNACDAVDVRLLPTDTPPTTVAVPSQTGNSLMPGEFLELTFTSGASSERGRQTTSIRAGQAGRYALKLANANPGLSGYWLIWDYLSLKEGETAIWEIGEDEAPTDYTEKAFSEFCDTSIRTDCTTEFKIGVTRDKDFAKDINDGRLPEARITFTLTEQQARANLTLVLSTLYSTHPGVKSFKMKVTLDRES